MNDLNPINDFSSRIDRLNRILEAEVKINPITKIWVFLKSHFLPHGKNYIKTLDQRTSKKTALILQMEKEFKDLTEALQSLNKNMKYKDIDYSRRIKQIDSQLDKLQSNMTQFFKANAIPEVSDSNIADPLFKASISQFLLNKTWNKTKVDIENDNK